MTTANQNPEQLLRDHNYNPTPAGVQWQIRSEKHCHLTTSPRSINTNIFNPLDKTVDNNFQEWIFKKRAGTLKYTEEPLQWLLMIKDYIANSFHVDRDDFRTRPFEQARRAG